MAILLNKWMFPIGQSGEASQWRVWYQPGLPRLVGLKLPFPTVGAWQRRKYIFTKHESFSHLISDKGVCRTAPDTPGPLIILHAFYTSPT